jgi:hypothetical protein
VLDNFMGGDPFAGGDEAAGIAAFGGAERRPRRAGHLTEPVAPRSADPDAEPLPPGTPARRVRRDSS